MLQINGQADRILYGGICMIRSLKAVSLGSYVRATLDFLLVHLSVLAALSVTVLYDLSHGQGLLAKASTFSFWPYYGFIFGPLSAGFPVLFALSGFYTRTRTFPRKRKVVTIARGTTIAAAVFLIANYLLMPTGLVVPAIAITFCVICVLAIPSARLVKASVLRYLGAADISEVPGTKTQGTVLVVGGAGYIGSHLVRRLLQAGYKVRALDKLVYGYGAIRKILHHPNFELVVGDCRNIQTVVGAVKGVHTIIHLAAIVGDPACDFDKRSALEINYAATRMLVEVAKGNGVQRFIFASSCSVYGAAESIMDECSEVRPISLYARTKVDSEESLLRARSISFHPTILRLATVFGNSYRPRFDLVVNLLTAKAHQDHTITIYNGEQWRPFIHVRDIAEAVLLTMEAPVELISGEIFNVGDSEMNFTLSNIAEIIQDVFPATRVEHIENSDRRNYRVSFEKIRNHLGFRCTVHIKEGVVELKQALERGEIRDYKDAYYNNQKYLQTTGSPSHTDEIDERVMAAFAEQASSQEIALEAAASAR